MFKSKHILLASFAAVMAVSCSKNEQSIVSPSTTPVSELSDAKARLAATDDLRENVARKLAKALGNAQFRAYLKAEVLKKFDGDYNLLLSSAMTYIVNNYPNSELASLASSTAGAPLLNIAVPVKADEWNTQTVAPLVAFLPEGFDEKTATEIKAFDASGNVHLLDAKTAPTTPVVVISNSERAQIEQGKVSLKPGLISLNRDNKGARLPGETTQCGTMPYDQALYLTGFRSGNISAIESWANGAPEIKMNCYYTNQSSQANQIVYGDNRGNLWEPPKRADVDNRFWRFSNRLMRWNSSYGDMINFALWEEDSGSILSIPIEVKGKWGGVELKASTTVNIQDKDEFIGVFPVDRTFCTNSEATAFGNQSMQFILDYYEY